MASDSEIIQAIRQAFAKCPRPDHFTNFTHCEECAEHDGLLRSRDIDTLRIEDVGNPGWNPMCFTSPEGFAYYLPALVRLTLAEPEYSYVWYGTQLLFHLLSDGPKDRRLLELLPEHRLAVVQFLRHLVETRAALADSYCSSDDLFQALDIWSDESKLPNRKRTRARGTDSATPTR